MAVWRVPNRVELEYAAAMERAMQRLLPAWSPSQPIESWLAEFAEQSRQVEVLQIATEIARSMVAKVNVHNARTWREASRQSQRSLMLFRYLEREMEGPVGARLQELVRENATLISSIPQEVAGRLTAQITKAQQMGVRPETIAKHMRVNFPKLTRNRIHLIARTETSKATVALTRSRAEGLNLDWFEWLTSHDQRVRMSHRNIAGVLVSWHDLPSPEALVGEHSYGKYAAGDTFNCRCISSPILTLDDMKWPARIYMAGAIHRMTRAEFQRMTGIPERVAA
jgi:SPP1 gp7 family putative phage head morphogenesis protein